MTEENPGNPIGKVNQVEITAEIEKSFLDYAMSVIVQRALPDVRDGLKPVHRRILYAMEQMSLHHSGKYTKSAKVVGEVLGKYHPHGDIPVYDALVRLAQDFSMRYMLVDGQGNFGSVDGDSPAAMRYTEVRLAAISEEILADINKETVDTTANFDNTLNEPTYLPSKLPNLLLMGSEGIAVGLATKIPPHNLTEVIDAVSYAIGHGKAIINKHQEESTSTETVKDVFDIPKISFEGKDTKKLDLVTPTEVSFESEATVDDLVQFIKGPDFPTGGAIYDANQIKEVYATGRGRIVMRGKAEIEEGKGGKSQIIISEIPYQVNKAEMVARIAQLVKDKKVEGISDLRDESDREGIRVVVELKRDARPKSVLNNLYKHTALQTTFPANFVALVDQTPQTLTLKQMIVEFVKHRQQVVVRRSIYDLKQNRARAHILEGLKIALDNLDAVIKTIKESKSADDAKINLMTRFKLSELQSVAILDMQLRRLAALERQKIEDEYKAVMKVIAFLEDLLKHPEKILVAVGDELSELKQKYGDERRTKVYKSPIGEFSEEDLVPLEETIITITGTGYIKRQNPSVFKAQHRGGKGVMGMETKEEDEIAHLVAGTTHDDLFFLTSKGRIFKVKTWELPEGSRQSKGQALVNLINTEQDETVQSVLAINPKQHEGQKYLLLVTRKGTVKKSAIADYENIRTSGLIAIKLEAGDELVWARTTSGEDDILLATHEGKSIKFKEKDVRPTGRDTMGVRGILLGKEDYVIGMESFPPKMTVPEDKRKKVFRDILVVMEKGIGKRTPIGQFPVQNRGGQGVKVAQVTPKTGKVVALQMVDQTYDEVVLTSRNAQVIKLPLRNIPELSRATQGVILMRFQSKDDSVAAVTCLLREGGEEETTETVKSK
ncbi:MAG: gyrase subunit A protein [Microgenomates group bacterium GW2011_GWA1_Microgenomates_45_10]|nr:MAG: gyrase subunit A protein [Microgenomates group bacterium GW2011_GWA1_Microgenomates_45_10]